MFEDKYAATEQVIPDYLLRIARGTEAELVALPIFVTRGMVQRKFVMRRDTKTPKDLKAAPSAWEECWERRAFICAACWRITLAWAEKMRAGLPRSR